MALSWLCRTCRLRRLRSLVAPTCVSVAPFPRPVSNGPDGRAPFGFQSVPENDKVNKVFEVFQNVSPKYDVMNDAMSLGVHRLWKDSFVSDLGPTPGSKILDVAGGTGDIAFRILERLMTAEDREALGKTSGIDPSSIVSKGIKDTLDVYDAAAGVDGKLEKPRLQTEASTSDPSTQTTSKNNEEAEDELLDPNFRFQVNPRSEAGMEAIRQKIDRLSIELNNNAESLDGLSSEHGEFNPVEKGGLFVAGNIAGAKKETVTLDGFRDEPILKAFHNDPNLSSELFEQSSPIEIFPVDSPRLERPVFDGPVLRETLTAKELAEEFDLPPTFVEDPNFAAFDGGEHPMKNANATSSSDSSSDSESDSNVSAGASKQPPREPKKIVDILSGDPNVHAEGFSAKDLDVEAAEGSIDHQKLKVAPSYHVPEKSPDLDNFMTGIEEGLGGFGMISDEGMSHDEELNVEHELFENVLPSGGHVTVLDLSPKMIEEGRAKSVDRGYSLGVSWTEGDAESLPFPEDTFDAYTIAFGIRNCTHLDRVLSEAYRVLKPGGRFLCLEFSHVENPLLKQLYDAYSFQLIPVMGQVIANDWKSYQYLVESIRTFPDQHEFKDMIEDAGFRMVKFSNLSMGIAAIHSGFKV